MEILDNLKGMVFEVGKEFTARPGDRILVVNDVVLGVYTGQRVTAPPQAPPRGRPPAPAAAPAQTELRERFLRTLREVGGSVKAGQLTGMLGIDSADGPAQYRLRVVTQQLQQEGRIRAHGKTGKGRIYELVETPLLQSGAPCEPLEPSAEKAHG